MRRPSRLGNALAVALLLALVGAITFALERALEATRAEEERARRGDALVDAAAGLAGLAEQARDLAGAVVALEELARVADDRAPDAARGEAFRQLDRQLARLTSDEAVLALEARLASVGAPLIAYDRHAGPPLLTASAPPALAREALAGAEALAVEPGRRGPVLRAAVARPRTGLVVVATLDASAALARCEEAAGGGAWALLASGQPVWPPGDAPPAPPLHAAPTRAGAAVAIEGDELAAEVRVLQRGRLDWRLLARAPFQPASDLVPLGLGALSLALVLVLGARGARAALLQRSLAETERQERELSGTLDAITDVLIVLDRERSVVRANRGAREALGWEPVGRPYAEVLAARCGEAREDELAALEEVFFHGEPRQSEAQGVGERWWHVVRYPIFAPDLTVRGVVEHARDVTQTRLLRAQLVQSEKLSTLGEMAAGIAHEINNPLGVVSMFAQLLQEELREALGEEAPALERARLIEEQAVSAGEIVKGLLRFSRKSEGERRPFDPRAAVGRALSIVRHQKMLKEIEVVERYEDVPPVLGDEGQLAQVALNLVINACHAMEGRGTLTLTIRAQEAEGPPPPGRAFGQPEPSPRRVHVAVADTGPGIPPERLERIFEPFFTTKVAGHGTGLGLSVGFAIVRDHGGCVWVHSRHGVGTTFTLDLPAVE